MGAAGEHQSFRSRMGSNCDCRLLSAVELAIGRRAGRAGTPPDAHDACGIGGRIRHYRRPVAIRWALDHHRMVYRIGCAVVDRSPDRIWLPQPPGRHRAGAGCRPPSLYRQFPHPDAVAQRALLHVSDRYRDYGSDRMARLPWQRDGAASCAAGCGCGERAGLGGIDLRGFRRVQSLARRYCRRRTAHADHCTRLLLFGALHGVRRGFDVCGLLATFSTTALAGAGADRDCGSQGVHL